MSRAYPRLNIETFGDHLLRSGDLDPVYIALHKMELDEPQLNRWLVAYWSLYHVGTACYMSELEGPDFWEALTWAAVNDTSHPTPHGERWPRGSERRHWRGHQALAAVEALKARYGNMPEQMVRSIATWDLTGPEHAKFHAQPNTSLPFSVVAARAQEHRSFGPWISFKVADMLDRLDIASVSFDNAAVFMFDDPTKAALMQYRMRIGAPADARVKDEEAAINAVVDYLKDHFKSHTAPPLHDRPVGLQEVETILCKWKSHTNGHYPLNNDIDEINHGLQEWREVSETARAFLHAMPVRMGVRP